MKKTQSITASSKTVYYGRKAFNINAKSNGNGKLSYSSDNKKVASVSLTGKVSINGCGTAVITISASATDTYKAATKKITINVKAPNISLFKIKSTKKNTISVSWKKIKGLSNYEVWFSKSKSFKSGVVKKKVSASKTSLAQKISGSSKKKVYVKIRTSKDGKTGSWSKVKSVKVK